MLGALGGMSPHGGIGLRGSVGGVPILSAAEQMVETATHESLGGQPDWTMNMAIVDHLQQHPQDSLPVMESLKRKIMSKKHGTGLLAVILLEALVKNCPAFHPFVGQRDFMEVVLVKSLPRSIRKPTQGPSLNSLLNEPSDIKSPLAIQRWESILKCIQAWSLAFDSSQYPIFHEMHRMLERRGVKFPPVDKEENAPVFLKTPARSTVQPSAPQLSPRQGQGSASSGGSSRSDANDIKTALETVKIFREVIDNGDPATLMEDELVQQLFATCRSNAGTLSSRLTRAANAVGSTDEEVMMQLISAHESVQEVIKYYEDVISGIRKPKSSKPTQPSSQRTALKESKEDEGRRPPVYDSSAGRSSIPDPFAAPQQQPPKKTRRPSDLPADLTQFDLLGITPSPPVPQPVAAQPHPAQVDPFSVSAFDSFPQPSNPVASVTSSSAVTTTPATKRGSASTATPTGGLIAPPPSSNRRRKESSAKRGSESTPIGQPTGSPATKPTSSPVVSQPSAANDIFNLDLLMANNSPPLSTPPTSSQPSANAYPFAAATNNSAPMNIFDAFGSPPPSSNKPPTAPSSAQKVNPFASFSDDAPPDESEDPFAQIATRTPNPSKAGSLPKQPNAFGF